MARGALVAVLALSCAALPLAAASRGDERGARDPALRACDEMHDRGSAIEAASCYRGLAQIGSLATQAEAYWMLGDLKTANERFREAVAREPEAPDRRVRWGYLYVQSHQQSEAAQLFQEALDLDEGHVPAKLGMATVLASRFEGKAGELVDDALELRPKQVLGHLLRGQMALEVGHLKDARASFEEALEMAVELDRVPLEVYAQLASLEMLEGNRDNEWVTKALDYNPRYGQVYADQAHYYVITRRYREATERLRRAVRLAPELWRAHAELGVNLMREGQDAEGRHHLETAYEGDPYSAKTVNTLRLLDSFDQFETIEDPDPESPGGVRAIFRLDKDESELLFPYVRELTERALAEFSRKYDFRPQQPVHVELYPNHDDFAVRSIGMPGVGLLGVTFGYVVVMDSPSGREPGGFHWGTTLWHELAHVFTLEATQHLVPRWYSEGISMYEEWLADARWGESVSPEYINAVREGDLLPIIDLDRGFVRPEEPAQVAISYLQAGYACSFIAERWGETKLLELLRGFAANESTAANIRAVLRIEPEDFDAQFDKYTREYIGAALDGQGAWRRSLKQALEAARERDWEAVLEPARAARAAYPQHVGPGSSYVLLATALDSTGDRDAAIEELREYERRRGRQPETLRKLARWLEEAGRPEEAAYTYEGLLYNWPQDGPTHSRLGSLYLAAGQHDKAIREFRAVLALGPHDRATAEFDLAQAYVKIGDLAAARLHVLQALELAPTFGPALELLLRLRP